jgi:hypothetical protein
MKLFKGALTHSKAYRESFVPDPDFLVRLVTDYRSHQAIIRQGAGAHFKNFDNFIRGKHQLSPVTMRAMSEKLGVELDEIAKWPHGKEDGPLLPDLLNIFSSIESLPYRFTTHILDAEVLCSCCKNNILDDRDAFWTQQNIVFNEPEFGFAERILRATIGASFFWILLGRFAGEKTDWPDVYMLAHRCKYPIAHWLSAIQTSYRVNSLAELAVKMQAMDSPDCHVPYERLKKWSSGMDLLPVSVAKALSQASGHNNEHWISFFLARALSFVIDFLVAAAPGAEPKRQVIQEIVENRFVGLGQNLRIAMAKQANEAKGKDLAKVDADT